MKTSSLLLALLATGVFATAAHAAPPAQLSTSAQLNYHWVGPDGLVIGPKANPGALHAAAQKVNVGQTAIGGTSASAIAFDDYCGNGKKPIPGVGGPGPKLNGALNGAQGASVVALEPERCGTRIPGRIPGGLPGGIGPR